MDTLNPGSPWTWRDWLVVLLILGFLSMSRSFAYIGLRPFFIGEIALATFLISIPGAFFHPWLGSLLQRTPLSGFCYCLYASLIFGGLQCLRGFLVGHNAWITLQSAVFHVYPLYFFVGLWVGRRHADLLPKTVNLLAWCHGLYAVTYILLLSQQPAEEMPVEGSVSWFGQPYGGAVALLGILCYAANVRYRWLPLFLNGFALLVCRCGQLGSVSRCLCAVGQPGRTITSSRRTGRRCRGSVVSCVRHGCGNSVSRRTRRRDFSPRPCRPRGSCV